MTTVDYTKALDERICNYLEAKMKHYQISPFVLKFTLIVEPFKEVLSTPLVMQDGPKSFNVQESIQVNFNNQYLKKINQFLDELEAQK